MLGAQMREIVSVMGREYPSMFRDDQSTGYGLGGVRGLQGLANNMLDNLRGRQGPRKKCAEEQADGQKKGKRKLVYGNSNFLDQ